MGQELARLAGGTLVVGVFVTPAEPTEGACIRTLLAWTLHGGAAHSFTDSRRWLEDAAFGPVDRPGERWLSATRKGG